MKKEVKEFLPRSYWILTIQREGNFSTETVVIEGNIIMFLLVERELGRKTNITWSMEITKDEYEDLARTRSRDALNYRGNDDTLDGSILE